MKIKRFTLLTLPVLVLIVGAFVLMSSKNSTYYPRKTVLGELSPADEYLEYIRTIKANMETGTISPEEYFEAVKQANRMPKSKASLDISWSFIGPDNFGGRTRAIIVDKNDPDHILAGAASGGIYESFDGAKSWEPYDPAFSVSNISSITQDKDGNFYVGTGGHFENPVNKTERDVFFIGTGVYKLTGEGNFKLIKGPLSADISEDYSTISKVVASPTDANKLYVGMNNGFRILEIDDNGDLVNESDPISSTSACNDIEVSENGKVLVTFKGKIFLSKSGDANFVETTPALLYSSYTGFGYGRIEVAIAPSDDNIAYAAITAGWGAVNPNNLPPIGNNCLVGIYRSQDGGENWEIIRQGAPNVSDMYATLDGLGCTGHWANTLAVYPDDAGKILVGGDALYRWEQSSKDPDVSNGSWTRVDFPLQFSTSDEPFPNYLHSGKHNIVWDPRNSDVAYITTNGGISKTENFNNEEPTYKLVNHMYNTTQYYSIDVNSKGVVIAGSHDNGTHILNLKNTVGNPAYQVYGNNVLMDDHAFDCQLSSINPQLGFASKSHNRIRRIQGIGTSPSSSNYSEAEIYNTNNFLGGLCAGAGGCTPYFYSTSTLWESFNHEGSSDSVEFVIESLELPPFVSGTEFAFEGNNNRYEQTDTIDTDIYPIDTISGSSGTLDTFLLADGNTIIMNFDTIEVNISNKTINISRRANPNSVNLNFNYGDELSYENGLLGLSSVATDSMITIIVDTFKTAAQSGEVYVLVENAFINFRYTLKLQDKVQSIFATANWPGRGGSNVDRNERNIFISRDLLKGTTDIKWFMIGGASSTPSSISGDILDMEFSSDGNHLFVATVDFIGGKVYRISDIDSVLTNMDASDGQGLEDVINGVLAGKCHKIGDFPNQAVTSISVDPNNADNVVVALGNYGGMGHISRTTIGTTAMDEFNTFESITGSGNTGLPRAPAYAVLLDKNDRNRVLIGTELGVFGTDNAFAADASTVNWTNESEGIGEIPVFDLVQMRHNYTKASNDGQIYAATHGRGAFMSDVFVGLNKHSMGGENSSNSSKSEILVYPNPVDNYATVVLSVENAKEELEVQIFNIQGKLIKTLNVGGLKTGKNNVKLNLQELNRGTYILRTIQAGIMSSTKFIKH